MQLETFIRYFVLVYFALYFIIAFVWRSWLLWKRTGVNPVVFTSGDNARDFIGRVFKLLFAATAFAVFAFAASGALYSSLAPISWLERAWLMRCGVVLLSLSLIWTAIAQAQMGASWRIGIDSKRRTELVERGVFGWSRNPIFLGMMATLLGLFLTAPNALTLLIAGLGITLIQIQVRLEEEHLSHLHGAAYETYRLRVHRWL